MGAGFVLWLTGLPCAGKSTLAHLVAAELVSRGQEIEVLDGDVLRPHLSKGLGFSREDRDENVRRIGFAARLLSRHGVGVIAAVVSPYAATRLELARSIENFWEVHVDCSLRACEARDVKGMYAEARSGKRPGFTGIDDPYEPPAQPLVRVQTDAESAQRSAARILEALHRRGFARPARGHVEPHPPSQALGPHGECA